MWKNINCDPITLIFLQSINQEEMKDLERQIRFILSLTAKGDEVKSETSAEKAICRHLQHRFLIDDNELYYNDPEEGEIKVISDFTKNFNNKILELVDFEYLAKVIADKIYVGQKDYRYDTYCLTCYTE